MNDHTSDERSYALRPANQVWRTLVAATMTGAVLTRDRAYPPRA